MRLRAWREWHDCPPDQVGNAKDSTLDLTPATAPLLDLREKWAPLLHGQAVPLIGERTFDAEPCFDE